MFELGCFVVDKLIHKHDLSGLKELYVVCGLII